MRVVRVPEVVPAEPPGPLFPQEEAHNLTDVTDRLDRALNFLCQTPSVWQTNL